MGSFILSRLIQTLLVLLVAALVSFALFRYVGDPVNNMVGQSASLADREAMRQALGLDDSVVVSRWDHRKGDHADLFGNLGVLASHEAFDTEDRILGIRDCLAFGRNTNEPFA